VSFGGHYDNQFHFKGPFTSNLKNFPIGWDRVGKRMNVFVHIFTKDQPTDIRYTSNYAVCDGETSTKKKFAETLLSGLETQKAPQWGNPSQMSLYVLSFGQELTHKHLEKRKLCNSATAIGLIIQVPKYEI
jgi:hypothetical protein